MPRLMGILNVTPDSFYDRGKYFRRNAALRQAEKMIEEGADILDVGGESTRPGSIAVTLDEELKRVVPVVRTLVKKFPKVPVSVDTQKSEVAAQSLDAGAQIVNDVSALRTDGERMANAIRQFRPQVVLMHMQGTPQTMQKNPRYRNVVGEVKDFLSERIRWAVRHGLSRKKIWIDPGIGFGKRLPHNLELIKNIPEFFSLKCPVLIGCSRKSFIGRLMNPKDPRPPEERLEGSLTAACWLALQGVSILRVHDVGATKKALRVLDAVAG